MSVPELKRSLTGSIAARLRQDILLGTYPAGTQLRQDALARSFGVSRIPVREALFRLDAEGLVRITPQKGAVVAGLSETEIRDVFELRTILEPRLLENALARHESENLDAAAHVHELFKQATAANDIREWGSLNARFHAALCAAADLPRTAAVVETLLQTSDRFTRFQLSSREAMKRAVDEHAELLRLCRSGQIEDACNALRTHISLVGKDLLDVIALSRTKPAAEGVAHDAGRRPAEPHQSASS